MGNEMKNEVNFIIEKVRPYVLRDGGDIELVNVEDGIVYVKMGGACVGCAAIDVTLKQGIETMLLESVPGVIAVVALNDWINWSNNNYYNNSNVINSNN